MRSGSHRILLQSLVLGLASAIPVAVRPAWGWVVTIPVAAGGSLLLARDVRRRYVRPVERLAETVRPLMSSPNAPADELAQMVAFEYRDTVGRLEEVLLESRRRQTALDYASDGVVLLDGDGLVEHANPSARALLGGRELQVSRAFVEPNLVNLVHRAQRLEAPTSEELTLRMPAARHIMARAIPLSGGGAVLVMQDLSEAYRLDRVRRDFVANVSHELKTPVSGMRALADVAVTAFEDGDLESARRFVDRLQKEGDRLSDLVADLLDLSRVEAGQDMQIELVDVRALLDSVTARMAAAAEAKGLELEVAGPDIIVDADASQLGTAVHNLLDNAIRYSELGIVRASVDARDGWALIRVADEGIGIPGKELTRIFERFYRVDRARSRSTGGTGLGLSIVRHVAENHGGHIDVESELGMGSTFTLRIPLPVREPHGDENEGNAA